MKVPLTALALLIAIAARFPLAAPALAENGRTYARVTSYEAALCSEADDSSALFFLPYTYCVEVLTEDDGWCFVRYARNEGAYKEIMGYCRADGLTPTESLPENEYLIYPVTVTLRANLPDSTLEALAVSVTASYYGSFRKNGVYCSYVLYDGKFCYAEETFNDWPYNELPAEPAFSAQDGEDGNAKLVTALIVTAVAAAAVAALVLSGKRKVKS